MEGLNGGEREGKDGDGEECRSEETDACESSADNYVIDCILLFEAIIIYRFSFECDLLSLVYKTHY